MVPAAVLDFAVERQNDGEHGERGLLLRFPAVQRQPRLATPDSCPEVVRICFVCNEYPPGPHGGIGSSTQVLARGLVGAGHQVRVIGMYPASYPAPEYEEDQGVRVWRLRRPGFRFDWPWARYRLFRTVGGWSRRGRIDLVDVPDWEGWAAGWPRLSIPVVVRLCGSITYFAAELGRKVKGTTYWLERSCLRRADFWCSKSIYTADKTRRMFALRSGPHAVLYNPIEPRGPVPFESRCQNQVVFTGTLTEKKGIVSLIRAWPEVVQACPDAQLRIFGKDGRTSAGQSMRSLLESQLDGHLGKSVHFCGHVARERLFEELQRARVAVFPSYAEAFANAPMEAMACGCPTIYSRRGSGPELIQDGHHGLLVDPDRPGEIASAIVRVLREDELARRLADAGKERVEERLSIQAILAKNVAFYRSCVQDFGTKRHPRCSSR